MDTYQFNTEQELEQHLYSILSIKKHNPHYLNRYIKFILNCKRVNEERGLIKIGRTNFSDIELENHHICPEAKEMFPEYRKLKIHKWNSISLTPRQHYDAHWFLWKCYRNNAMTHAFWMLSHINSETKISAKSYENLKNGRSKILSDHWKGEKNPNFGTGLRGVAKEKMIASKKGSKLSEEHKRKIGLGGLGKKDSEETRLRKSKAQSKENNPMFGRHDLLWWTNDIETVRSTSCPGQGWRRGRAKSYKVWNRDDTKFFFFHEDYGLEYCSRFELSQKYTDQNLSTDKLAGNYHKGWSKYSEKPNVVPITKYKIV